MSSRHTKKVALARSLPAELLASGILHDSRPASPLFDLNCLCGEAPRSWLESEGRLTAGGGAWRELRRKIQPGSRIGPGLALGSGFTPRAPRRHAQVRAFSTKNVLLLPPHALLSPCKRSGSRAFCSKSLRVRPHSRRGAVFGTCFSHGFFLLREGALSAVRCCALTAVFGVQHSSLLLSRTLKLVQFSQTRPRAPQVSLGCLACRCFGERRGKRAWECGAGLLCRPCSLLCS